MFVLYGNVSLIEIMILSVFFVVGTGLGAGKNILSETQLLLFLHSKLVWKNK